MQRSLKQFGELDIKLKNNVFKSFRFEIVLYSILSLIYTVITELVIAFLVSVLLSMFHGVRRGKIKEEIPIDAIKEVLPSNELKDSVVNSSIMDDIGKNAQNNVQQFYEKWQFIAVIATVAIIAAIALFIFYFLLLTRKFSSYLVEISSGIDEVAIGNFNAKIPVRGEDELAYIADRVNHMALDIKLLMDNERNNEKEKNDLITNVAHDLRTPLTSILGYLDLARNAEKTNEETKQKYISIAYEKSKRLEKLIDNLFDFTKVGFGEDNIVPTELNIAKFMEQMIEEFYPSFEEAKLECEFTTNSSEAVILGDGDLLARAIGNLLSNAVKYGRDGKVIKIKVFKEESRVRLMVINYGEIIPEKDLEHVFDKFFRVETSRSVETGGTGLGLAIAKRIVLMHGGSISVRSDFDGTVFDIAFKLKEDILSKNAL